MRRLTLISLVFRKDLRRALPGMSLVVFLVSFVLSHLPSAAQFPPVTTEHTLVMGVQIMVLSVAALAAFLQCLGLLQADPFEGGWWRTRPVAPSVLFLSKLASGVVVTFLPVSAAFLFAGLLGVRSPIPVAGLALYIVVQQGAAFLFALGVSSLARTRATAVLVILGLIFLSPFLLPKHALAPSPHARLLLASLGISFVAGAFASAWGAFHHGRTLKSAAPFLGALLFLGLFLLWLRLR